MPADDEAPLSATIEWALGRLHAPLTVEDLAANANMNSRTFARRFVEATGTTPHRWLTRNRVHRAQELLPQHSCAILEPLTAPGGR